MTGPAGRLEGLLALPDGGQRSGWAAVVCHPHPLLGGNMHNKVVFHVARALAGLGWPVLRFNFRGVGASQGSFEPRAALPQLVEAAARDLCAAIDWLAARFHGASLCGAGFSFGAHTLLHVANSEPRLTRLLAIGTPAGLEGFPGGRLVSRLAQPKLFIQGELDEFGPPDAIRRLVAVAAEPKRLIFIPGARHFFDGHLNELRTAAIEIDRDHEPGKG